jgi:hypothetical protein
MFNAMLYAVVIQPEIGHLDHMIDFLEAWAHVQNPQAAPCMPAGGQCYEYLPQFAPASFYPNNPFTSPDLIPAGYTIPPWYANPGVPLPGVLPSDAMVNFLAIPSIATIPDLLSSGLPRVRFEVTDPATAELELVQIPQGGIALVTTDNNPLSAQVVNLNSASIGSLSGVEGILSLIDLALDLEIVSTEIIEFEFTTEGVHYIDVTFIPNVDADVILGFGGGIRRFEICQPQEDTDLSCCDDLIDQLAIIKAMIPPHPLNALPPSVTAPNRPRGSFVTDPNDTTGAAQAKRLRASCATVYKYFGEIARQVGDEIGTGLLGGGWSSALAAFAGGGIGSLAFAGGALLLGGGGAAVLQDWDAWEEVVCCFQSKLGEATANTFDVFKALLDSPDCDLSANAQLLALVVHTHNQIEQNYKLFNAILSDEFSSDISADTADDGRCKVCQPCEDYHNFAINPYGVLVKEGIYVPGQGYKAENYTTPQNVPAIRLTITVMCPTPGYIKTAELETQFLNTGGSGSLFIAFMLGDAVVNESGGIATTDGGDSEVIHTLPTGAVWADRIRIRMQCTAQTGQYIRVYGLKVGAGNPPLP